MKTLMTIFFIPSIGLAKNIRTNELSIYNAPRWVKQSKVEKVTDSVQSKLEWRIRRVPLYWHISEESFIKAQSLGAGPAAVTIKSTKKTQIQMGPKVNRDNYQRILGHELVHVIFFQKYKGAIPRWLEEGFANHLSRKEKVNYSWLSQQRLPEDVTKMGHPYQKQGVSVQVHYKVSQALVEMLKKRCDLDTLLRLSVERKMKDYIATYCNIKDINKAFKDWILEKR